MSVGTSNAVSVKVTGVTKGGIGTRDSRGLTSYQNDNEMSLFMSTANPVSLDMSSARSARNFSSAEDNASRDNGIAFPHHSETRISNIAWRSDISGREQTRAMVLVSWDSLIGKTRISTQPTNRNTNTQTHIHKQTDRGCARGRGTFQSLPTTI